MAKCNRPFFKLPVYLYVFVALILFSSFTPAAIAQQATDTIKVYFDLNKTDISQQEAIKINSAFVKADVSHIVSILIFGYADNLGGESHNTELSEQRAKNVSAYMVSLGMDKDQIKLCVGKGQVTKQKATKTGFPEDRRVDIVVTRTIQEQPKAEPPAPEKVIIKYPVASTPPGQTFVLDNLYFYANKHSVREDSYPQLEELYNELIAHPAIKIRIEGHVCCIHPEADPGAISFKHIQYDATDLEVPETITDQQFAQDSIRYRRNTLSVNRAKFIYQYLLKKGIPASRMKYVGYGNTRPLVKEETKEDQNRNKRVEVRIMTR